MNSMALSWINTSRNNLHYILGVIFINVGTDIMADIKFEINETIGILSDSIRDKDLETIQPIQHIEALGQVFDLPISIRSVYEQNWR